MDATIKLLLRMGADREKTVLGLAFYGRAFLLSDPLNNWVHIFRTTTKHLTVIMVPTVTSYVFVINRELFALLFSCSTNKK